MDILRKLIAKALELVGLRPTSVFPYLARMYRYSAPHYPLRVLGSDFFAPVTLVANHESLPEGELYQAWKKIPGAHKWHHYFQAYEDVMSEWRVKPIRMLEIGVYKGGSLRMWRDYLHAQSIIVGIDIDPQCARFADEGRGVFVRVGDQSDPNFLSKVATEFGPFDVILDDGSHLPSHMIESFKCLFPNALKCGGIYLAEDVHTNFWKSHRDRSYTFVDLSKDLVDFMHSAYFALCAEPAFRRGHPKQANSALVPRVSREIDEIRFRDSMIIIRKRCNESLPVSEMTEP